MPTEIAPDIGITPSWVDGTAVGGCLMRLVLSAWVGEPNGTTELVQGTP